MCTSNRIFRTYFQERFPPNIYYKIFTHRPVQDLCANSPKDYTNAASKGLMCRDLHNKGDRVPQCKCDAERGGSRNIWMEGGEWYIWYIRANGGSRHWIKTLAAVRIKRREIVFMVFGQDVSNIVRMYIGIMLWHWESRSLYVEWSRVVILYKHNVSSVR